MPTTSHCIGAVCLAIMFDLLPEGGRGWHLLHFSGVYARHWVRPLRRQDGGHNPYTAHEFTEGQTWLSVIDSTQCQASSLPVHLSHTNHPAPPVKRTEYYFPKRCKGDNHHHNTVKSYATDLLRLRIHIVLHDDLHNSISILPNLYLYDAMFQCVQQVSMPLHANLVIREAARKTVRYLTVIMRDCHNEGTETG